jgi:hypothetical protein
LPPKPRYIRTGAADADEEDAEADGVGVAVRDGAYLTATCMLPLLVLRAALTLMSQESGGVGKGRTR